MGDPKIRRNRKNYNQFLGLFCALHLFASVLSGEVGVWGMICFGRRKVSIDYLSYLCWLVYWFKSRSL